MLRLEPGLVLPPEQRLVLGVDTRDIDEAHRYAEVARKSEATIIKLGLELDGEFKPQDCADFAVHHKLAWIADRKIRATPKTMTAAIANYTELSHPPVGITICSDSGVEALKIAQKQAAEVGMIIFGVGHLSNIDDGEAITYSGMDSAYIILKEVFRAKKAGVEGFVASGKEVDIVNRLGLFSLVVATRSPNVEIEGDDQKRSTTLFEAVRDGGDLIEISRQVTRHADVDSMMEEMLKAREEVAEGLAARAA